jgi:serine/threonine-protein kinase
LDKGDGQKPGRRRDPTGELIGSYAVIAQIATGEATLVHLAQKHGALGFHRLAAIKRLKPEFAQRGEWSALLLEEARLSAGVQHANIVDVIDVGTEGGCYLVMDYIEGADLDVLLSRAGKERHARYVLPPIVDALHGLHAIHTSVDDAGQSLAMVHQAPRARHILIGIDGTARLTDFSQVAAPSLAPSHLRNGRLKPAYMAPEQVRGQPVDARTDLFILGITLWEALTGERLFQAETSEASKRAVLERHIPRPSDVGFKPPRALDRVCLRALAREPDQRYQDAAEMARELRDIALNQALYATAGELGQWVRALAGRSLIERRRALGADAPSLEIAIEAFESGNAAAQQAVEIANIPTDVTVAPSELMDSSAPHAESSESAKRAQDRAPLPSEPSRVTRMYTVAVAAPPSSARGAPRASPPPAVTLLGVTDGDRGRNADALLPSRPARDPAQPSPGAYRHIAADRRAAATLLESAQLGAPSARGDEAALTPQPFGGWPDSALNTTAKEVESHSPVAANPSSGSDGAYRPPTTAAMLVSPTSRGPLPSGAQQRRAPVLFDSMADGGSLRPPNRAGHMDLPDSDEEVESSSGLGFIAFLSVAIIALAGVVGYRQYSSEDGSEAAASPAAEEQQQTSSTRAGERELERSPGAVAPAAAPGNEAVPAALGIAVDAGAVGNALGASGQGAASGGDAQRKDDIKPATPAPRTAGAALRPTTAAQSSAAGARPPAQRAVGAPQRAVGAPQRAVGAPQRAVGQAPRPRFVPSAPAARTSPPPSPAPRPYGAQRPEPPGLPENPYN